MSDTSNLQDAARKAAGDYINNKQASATAAVDCGRALNELKEKDKQAYDNLIPTLPVGERQLQKFMQIAVKMGSTNPGAQFLGINVEARLCGVSKDIEDEIRETAKEDQLSQHEIMPLIAEKLKKPKMPKSKPAKKEKPKKVTKKSLYPKIRESLLQAKSDCSYDSSAGVEDGLEDAVKKLIETLDKAMELLAEAQPTVKAEEAA